MKFSDEIKPQEYKNIVEEEEHGESTDVNTSELKERPNLNVESERLQNDFSSEQENKLESTMLIF